MSTRLIPNVYALYAEGDTVVAHSDTKGMVRNGKPYINSYAWILTLKDGRIVRAFAFFDAHAFDGFRMRGQPAAKRTFVKRRAAYLAARRWVFTGRWRKGSFYKKSLIADATKLVS